MTQTSNLTWNDIDFGEETDHHNGLFDAGGVIPFLFAGTILFATVVVGSSVSLLSAGPYTMTSAILDGFQSIGLWAFGGFLATLVLALATTTIWHRHHRE
jgi:hypothetical protein